MKSVKKEMILVIGLLSVFATVSLVSVIMSRPREPEIEYRDRVVEVEKPIEVIKEVEKTIYVEVPVENVTEVEKEVKVEKSVYVVENQADLRGVDVVKLDDNLYEFEFTAKQCKEDTSQIKKIFDLHGIYISADYFGVYVFQNGELISKPGYIIKDIVLVNPRQMVTPCVSDDDYNDILPSNITDPYHTPASVLEYKNLNKEQISISFSRPISGHDLDGAEVIRVIFSVRMEE